MLIEYDSVKDEVVEEILWGVTVVWLLLLLISRALGFDIREGEPKPYLSLTRAAGEDTILINLPRERQSIVAESRL